MHSTTSPTRRRLALAALAAAVVLLVAIPASALARATCDSGEFCLYSNKDLSGGLYEFSGSDSNLWTNDFENEDTFLSAGLTRSRRRTAASRPGAAWTTSPSTRAPASRATSPAFAVARAATCAPALRGTSAPTSGSRARPATGCSRRSRPSRRSGDPGAAQAVGTRSWTLLALRPGPRPLRIVR
jgi:Peptidase inhibitor family I36